MRHSRTLHLRYLNTRDIDDHLGAQPGHILGIAGLGAPRPERLPAHYPFAEIKLAPLGEQGTYEIWSTDEPVAYAERDGIFCAQTDTLLFGTMQLPESPAVDFDSVVQNGYAKLFETLDQAGYGNILRVWNYFPDITREIDGVQRYSRFSRGRHEAFAARSRPVETAPAACAIGSHGGPVTIYFLTSRGAAEPIENPRQVSAYRYPSEYGPRSPTFSRATLGNAGDAKTLFISGTASIVGHESLHPGDPEAQTRETILNLRAVLAEAGKRGFKAKPENLALKIYVRRPEDFPIIRESVEAMLQPQDTAIYLQAEICRPELLLEIEGVAIDSRTL